MRTDGMNSQLSIDCLSYPVDILVYYINSIILLIAILNYNCYIKMHIFNA